MPRYQTIATDLLTLFQRAGAQAQHGVQRAKTDQALLSSGSETKNIFQGANQFGDVRVFNAAIQGLRLAPVADQTFLMYAR